MSNFNKYTSSKVFIQLSSIWKKIINNKPYRITIGVFIGAGLGLLYYKFVGCSNGTCALTSNPFSTTLIFGLMGGLFASDKKINPDVADKKNRTIIK